MGDRQAPRGAQRLRRANRHNIIALLRTAGPKSRAELARELGLSPTTSSSIVSELITDDVAEESEPTPLGSRGRPRRLVRLATPPGVLVGVDIGRRHLQVAVARRDERVLAERLLAIPAGADRSSTTTTVLTVIDELFEEHGLDRGDLLAVGLGLPGPVEQASQTIATGTTLPEWVGYDVVAVLRDELGIPVTLDNDANLGILGEARHGAARGYRHAAYVKVSTGIGAGLLLAGNLHRGAGGTAGELGHTPITPDGAVCRCGGRGCLETVASVPALLQMLAPTLGDHVELSRVLTLASSGDRGCLRAITDVGRHVGRALGTMCNLLNPEIIVVGGPLVAPAEPFLGAIHEGVTRSAIATSTARLEIVPARFERRSELVGALTLAAQTVHEVEHPL